MQPTIVHVDLSKCAAERYAEKLREQGYGARVMKRQVVTMGVPAQVHIVLRSNAVAS